MKKKTRLFLVVLLILLLTACTLPVEPDQVLPSQESQEEAEEAGIDYCALPKGTRLTWFDLSTFIFIPQNSYQMGFDIPEQETDYEPAHQVTLDAFWMHEDEVTNRQYANCVAAGVCDLPASIPDVPYWYEDVESLDDPVVGTSWEQADAYCEWIGARLPTEAEWELAARGTDAFTYPWGQDDPFCELANFAGCQDPEDDQPVFAGLLLQGISPFETLDMTGNVNEWVSDWYGADYYQDSTSSNPMGPEGGDQRVWRGGSYQTPVGELQTYLRYALEPDQTQPDLGFRCAWNCGEDMPPSLCQLPPIVGTVNPPIGDPSPPEEPNISGSGYCEWRNGEQYAGVVLSSSNQTDLSLYDITTLAGPVSCDPVGENQVVCYGGSILPGQGVFMVICPDCEEGYFFDTNVGFCKPLIQLNPEMVELLPAEDPEEEDVCTFEEAINGECIPSWLLPPDLDCPNGWQYDEECGCVRIGFECGDPLIPEPPEEECPPGWIWAGMCIPAGPIDLFGECEVGHHKVEPCGCIPYGWICVDGGQGGDGWQPLVFPSHQFMPDDPMKPSDFEKLPGVFPLPEECNQDMLLRCPQGTISIMDQDGCQVCAQLPVAQDCPEGYFFNLDAGCCIPEIPISVCPSWTNYDPVSNSCIPIVFESQSCIVISLALPGCGPQPRPTPDVSCVRPDQYSNQENCEDAGCRWDYEVNPLRGTCVSP